MLETPRLLLREFGANDLEAVHVYASDIDVTRYTSFGPNSLLETRDFLRRAIADAACVPRVHISVAIVEKASDRLIGSCGYMRSDSHGPQYMFGYVLHKDFWRKGYGTEVARALTAFAFTQLDAHRLWAEVFIENKHSARILERRGFRCEGVARQGFHIRGKWHDLATYAMLKGEWQKLVSNEEAGTAS